jgi:hypothetical protein
MTFVQSVTSKEGDSMFGNGKFAVRGAVAAGLAGLAMMAAAPALASARPAAVAGAPAATGSFTTWSAAQKAAGFRLKKAKRTYGLTRTHPIIVGKCEVTGKLSKHIVYAEWNGSKRQSLAVDQNNSGAPCGDIGAARSLGTYRIQGHKAHMFGYCGMKGEKSCKRRNIGLVLEWKAGKDYFVTFSNNEWRTTLAGFSRSLQRV